MWKLLEASSRLFCGDARSFSISVALCTLFLTACSDSGSSSGNNSNSVAQQQAACTQALAVIHEDLTAAHHTSSSDCVAQHASGQLQGTLEGCLLGDPAGAMAAELQAAETSYQDNCGVLPEVGADEVEDAAFASAHGVSGALRAVYGDDFDNAFVSADTALVSATGAPVKMSALNGGNSSSTQAMHAGDPEVSACQLEAVDHIQQCHLSRIQAFHDCQDDGLGNGPITVDFLEQCLADLPVCDLQDAITNSCGTVELADAFFGCGSDSLAETSACIEDAVECYSCLALNFFGNLSQECDLIDDGISNRSCVALDCSSDLLEFVDADGNPLNLSDGGKIHVNCPVVPNPTPTDNKLPARGMDKFAWNTFIAMNWPAVNDGYTRGIPDLTKRFEAAGPGDLTVWETLKEKREVFYRGSCTGDGNLACSSDAECTSMSGPCDLDKPPPGMSERDAASLRWSGSIQYGPQGEELASAAMCIDYAGGPLPDRKVTSSTKLHFDSLGETVEVQSEARESYTQLCAGYPVPDPEVACLLTDKPACCEVQGKPVGPRVWKGDPTNGGRPVLYEVKVNYDYFKYVTDPSRTFYLDESAAPAAEQGEFLLPWRTNALTGGNPVNVNAVHGYDAYSCFREFGHDGFSDKPCLIGAVHVKAAWILLDDEDPSRYHTARASYFKTDPNDADKICQTAGTFGLVGLHIIQRTHQVSPPETPAKEPEFTPIGGGYIFATWEHVDNDTAGFRYANYDFSTAAFYPKTTDTLPLNRQIPVLPGTVAANDEVHAKLGCPASGSVWCNYRLIGTQFKLVDQDDATITDGEQPYFLANLLLESNDGLQMFQGLPPNTIPIDKFGAFSPSPTNNTGVFDRTKPNSVFQKGPVNMGGCMGCHGVAQLNGFTFSFVSQDGQRGAGIDTETPGQFGPAPTP